VPRRHAHASGCPDLRQVYVFHSTRGAVAGSTEHRRPPLPLVRKPPTAFAAPPLPHSTRSSNTTLRPSSPQTPEEDLLRDSRALLPSLQMFRKPVLPSRFLAVIASGLDTVAPPRPSHPRLLARRGNFAIPCHPFPEGLRIPCPYWANGTDLRILRFWWDPEGEPSEPAPPGDFGSLRVKSHESA
jgi:hypothetical protein